MNKEPKTNRRDLSFLLNLKPIRTIDIENIIACMPHRYPFLLVDRVDIIEEKKYAVGTKCVTINEPFFQGHFPGKPMMPAVLVLESIAQTCCVMFTSLPQFNGQLAFFMGTDKAKFRVPVVPGQVLKLAVNVLRYGRFGKLRAEAYVDGNLVAEAEMSLIAADKQSLDERSK